ncbi:hypothetical protein [Roseibium aggregatum]|uniref:Uncharacterized protein n=1 Tax=Roseibium aggregatum TaxID=187304 RepID=A0A926S9B7_9HYPH|nr:hypothetical protein [Roseibium aggregatum]MBD1546654.1 hypothetical protein [Roseibium aggregatum]
MRPRIVMLSGLTRQNRHAVMGDLNDAILKAGGWVEGHSLFSNIATTFRLVLPASALGLFRTAVRDTGVALDDDSAAKLDDLGAAERSGDEEVSLTLNVTFIHEEPDLRRDVPAVPG